MKKLILIVALFPMLSCATQKKLSEVALVETTKDSIVEKLVPVVMAEDSAALDITFISDSLNQILIESVTEKKSKRLESNLRLIGNHLSYKIGTKRDTLYLPSKEVYKYQRVPYPVEKKVEVNKLTPMQRKQIWIGRILAVALLGFLAVKFNFKSVIIFLIKKIFKIN